MTSGVDPAAFEQSVDSLMEGYSEGSDQEEVADAPEVEQEQPSQQSQEDSFTGLDPNSLPDEVRPFYKSMQADYTRKTQEIAEQAKAYAQLEQFGGPEVARQAIDFVYRLENDPNYQYQVHQSLSQNLQSQGYSVDQADAMATDEIQEYMEGEEDFEDDYEEPVQRVAPQDNRQLAELQNRLQRLEEEREIQTVADQLAQQTDYIKSQNPELTDYDLDRVYDIAHATDGDIIKAYQIYDEMQSRILTNYLQRKGTVATPQVIPNSAEGREPEEFTELKDPRVQQAAEARLKAAGYL